MTQDEFLAQATGMDAIEARAAGFWAEPCYCGGAYPHCTGWQLEHRAVESIGLRLLRESERETAV